MVRSVDLIINTLIKGKGGLGKLRLEIRLLEKALTDQARTQVIADTVIEKNILTNQLAAQSTRALMNADREQTVVMVDSEIRAEALNLVYQHRIDLLKKQRMELILLEMVKTGEITAEESLMAQKQIRMAMDKEDLRTKQLIRREILASTMSIFGMTMSIWQVTNALSALAGENKELKKDIQNLQAVMMGATGPVLFAMGLMQLRVAWTTLHVAIKMGLPTFFALAALYMALTASTKELRIIFGALTGALMVLTVRQMLHIVLTRLETIETYKAAAANVMKMSTSIPIMGAILAAAAVVGALAIIATMPKAQTDIGQYRRIEKSGLIFAHKPELIGNVSAPMEGGTASERPIEIVLNIDGDEFTRVWAKYAEREKFIG